MDIENQYYNSKGGGGGECMLIIVPLHTATELPSPLLSPQCNTASAPACTPAPAQAHCAHTHTHALFVSLPARRRIMTPGYQCMHAPHNGVRCNCVTKLQCTQHIPSRDPLRRRVHRHAGG